MHNFDKYCKALGVAPGDGPEAVKKAFRSRIKQHHPDANRQADDGHSRLLIEAYAEFKKGVPARPSRPASTIHSPGPARGQAPGDARGARGPAAGGAANQRGNGFAGFGNNPFRDPYEAGRRFAREASRKSSFRTVFTPPDENSPLGDIYVNLSDMIWGDDESTQVYGKRTNVREYRPSRRKGGVDDDMPAHPYDQAIEYYTRAEAVLRETVRRFERRSNRFKNSWVRDYIGELARVQVLFRDVSKRYPALSGKSLARVRQISELITEIKNSRTA